MTTMYTRHKDHVLNEVKGTEGLPQSELVSRLMKKYPSLETRSQTTALLTVLAKKKDIFRTRNHIDTQKKGYWFVWSYPQPSDADTEPIYRNRGKEKPKPVAPLVHSGITIRTSRGPWEMTVAEADELWSALGKALNKPGL